MEKGLPDADAEEKAIEQMGSPVKLGKQMNKLHKPKVDWFMIILLVTTLGLGFLPMIGLGYMDSRHFSVNKAIIVLLGGATAIGIMLIDYRKWKTRGWLFYSLGVLLLLVIKFFHNAMINGIPILLIVPIITIESTMALPFFFLAWSSFFSNAKFKIWHFGILFFVPFLLFFSIPSIPITFMYTVMVFVMLWWSKFSRKTILVISGITAGLFMIVAFTYWPFLLTYHKQRLLAFLNPRKIQMEQVIYTIEGINVKSRLVRSPGEKGIYPGNAYGFCFCKLNLYVRLAICNRTGHHTLPDYGEIYCHLQYDP